MPNKYPKKISKIKPYKKQKTIIHLTRFFDKHRYGGIEEVIRQISFNSKFNHHILCSGFNNKKINLTKNLSYQAFKKTFTIFGDIFSIQTYIYLFKNRNNFETIHIHYPYIMAFFYIILLPSRKNIIVTHHSDIQIYKFLKFFLFFIRKLANNFISFYHISSKRYFLNSEIKYYRSKTIFEHFSIDRKNIKIKKKKIKFTKYVLFIGRNTHYKGFDILEKIIERSPDINFICVTDYQFKKKYKNLILYKSIKNEFKYYLISKSRLIISTSNSRAESYGVSLMEGLYFNKPLLSFNLSTGINDIIQNNRNGNLIKKFDVKNYLIKLKKIYFSDSINKLYSDFSKKHKKKFQSNYKKINNAYL